MTASTPNDAAHTWISAYPFRSENNLLGVRLNAQATSSNALLVGRGNVLILSNPGTVEVYVALGPNSSTIATTAHFPVFPGDQTEVSMPDDGTGKVPEGLWIACITASAPTVLVAHLGYGN